MGMGSNTGFNPMATGSQTNSGFGNQDSSSVDWSKLMFNPNPEATGLNNQNFGSQGNFAMQPRNQGMGGMNSMLPNNFGMGGFRGMGPQSGFGNMGS